MLVRNKLIFKRDDDLYRVNFIKRDLDIDGEMTGLRVYYQTPIKQRSVLYIHKHVIEGKNTFTLKSYKDTATALFLSDLNKPYPITNNEGYAHLTYEDVVKIIEKQIRIFNMVYNTYVKLYWMFHYDLHLVYKHKMVKMYHDIVKRTTVDNEYPTKELFNIDYDNAMSLFDEYDTLLWVKNMVDPKIIKYLLSEENI